MFRKVFLVVAAVAALCVVAMPASAAKGGNSANAKKCQKGGWENFVRSDQTPFTSADDCTSYAAQGGVLTEPQSAYAPRTLCEDAGYTFSEGEEPVPGLGPSYFRCTTGDESVGMSLWFMATYANTPEVIAACSAYEPGARITGIFSWAGFSGIECMGAYRGT